MTPAVVMAKGSFGQSLTVTLTLINKTSADFPFEMRAQDVVVRDGKRIFVDAGQVPNSVAATAVFSRPQGIIKAGTTGSVDVRLTVPSGTDIRGIVAVFRGTQLIGQKGSVGMTASLGTLITFNLTENAKLQASPLKVADSDGGISIAQSLTNTGSEPVLPEGVAAFLDEHGKLAGKITFEPQRLMPGEALDFKADYPGQLRAGKYKVLSTFEFEGRTLSTESSYIAQ